MFDTLPLIAALAAGLMGGVHCVGMCGGIVGALTMASSNKASGVMQQLPLLFSYNIGRILSYVTAGALFGAVGQLSGGLMSVQSMQAVLAIVAGVMMVLMGLYIGGWSAILRHVEAVAGSLVWKRIEPFGRKLLPVKNPGQGFLLGVLWGWLPCGLVYSMLIWGLGSGSALNGALLMLAFGVGTLPNLLATGLLTTRFVNWMQLTLVRRIAATVLILFGIFTLYRGL